MLFQKKFFLDINISIDKCLILIYAKNKSSHNFTLFNLIVVNSIPAYYAASMTYSRAWIAMTMQHIATIRCML